MKVVYPADRPRCIDGRTGQQGVAEWLDSLAVQGPVLEVDMRGVTGITSAVMPAIHRLAERARASNCRVRIKPDESWLSLFVLSPFLLSERDQEKIAAWTQASIFLYRGFNPGCLDIVH